MDNRTRRGSDGNGLAPSLEQGLPRAFVVRPVTCEGMKQISYGKQSEAKNSAPKIQVMTRAMLEPPIHPRKQMKGFGDVSKDDYYQTSCAEWL